MKKTLFITPVFLLIIGTGTLLSSVQEENNHIDATAEINEMKKIIGLLSERVSALEKEKSKVLIKSSSDIYALERRVKILEEKMEHKLRRIDLN